MCESISELSYISEVVDICNEQLAGLELLFVSYVFSLSPSYQTNLVLIVYIVSVGYCS